ncbi:MAG TPA: cobalamin-binding protein [Casimicrobiaceae bacterium]|nr:cobalamin-binding protein [Casimicrobiaceae bacterium]
MRVLVVALLAMIALPLDAAVSVVDDANHTISLAAPAQRIVSLAPHATELLFAAGALPRVVAVVRGSDHPVEARTLPQVGDVNALDLERIVALKPDLVVTWPYTMPAQVATLKRRGIAVFTTDPASIDGIAANIERLGKLAGTRDAAADSAREFRKRYARLAISPPRDPPRVFYQVWNAPLFTIGGGHLISQAIRACGAQNLFESLRVPAPQVSIEAVLAARPDVIIAGADRAVRPQWLDDWRRWPELPAVRSGKLHVVDADLLHRPGPRFIDGVEALCAAIKR